MQLEPDKIYERLVTLGNEWAEARYGAELLDESKKPLLAKLASESNETSQNAKESWALRHADYGEHVKKMCEANLIEAKARVKYNAAITWADLQRTVAATERAANKHAA